MRIRTAKDLGVALRMARRARGISQSDFAEMIGASQRWVSTAENGRERLDAGKILDALARLDVRFEAVLPGTAIPVDGAETDEPDDLDQLFPGRGP